MQMKRPSVSITLRILGLILVFGCLGLLIFLRSSISQPIGLITDTSQYPEILEGYEGSVLIQHFPKTIPPEAQHVNLEYVPRIMQGGSHFQLKFNLPNTEIGDLYQEFAAMAIHKFSGGDSSIHSSLPNGIPTTYFYTSDTDNSTFPNSYEILVLQAVAAGSSEAEWNHGYSYGVAIDIGASEIVYWNEYW